MQQRRTGKKINITVERQEQLGDAEMQSIREESRALAPTSEGPRRERDTLLDTRDENDTSKTSKSKATHRFKSQEFPGAKCRRTA